MKAFVSMPMNPDFYPVWKAIKNACQRNGITARQANQLASGNNVLEVINKEIAAADLVIVDFSGDKFLSFANPKVVSEARFARKSEKIILVITQSTEAIPMEWKDHREVLYRNDKSGLEYLGETLMENLQLLKENLPPEPVLDEVTAALPMQRPSENNCRVKPFLLRPELRVEKGKEKIVVAKVGNINALNPKLSYAQTSLPVECHPPIVCENGSYAVFQSKEHNDRLWIYDRNGQIAAFVTRQPCYKPKISPNGSYLVFQGEHEGKIWIYDKFGAEIAAFENPGDCYRPLISPDDSFLVLQSKVDTQVWLYDKNGRQIVSFATEEACYTPKISANGSYITFQSKNHNEKVCNYDKNGVLVSSFETPESCLRPKISPDSTYAVYQSEEHNERFWIYDKFGNQLATFETSQPCQRPLISGDGRYIVFQSEAENDVWIFGRNGSRIAAFKTPQPCHRAKITPEGGHAVFFNENYEKYWIYDFSERELLSEPQFNRQIADDGFGRPIELRELNALMELALELGYRELIMPDFDVEGAKITSVLLEGVTPKIIHKYREFFENTNIFDMF